MPTPSRALKPLRPTRLPSPAVNIWKLSSSFLDVFSQNFTRIYIYILFLKNGNLKSFPTTIIWILIPRKKIFLWYLNANIFGSFYNYTYENVLWIRTIYIVFVPDKPLQARLWVRPEPPSGLALALNIRKALKGLPGNNHYRFFTRNEEEVFERAEHLNAGF